MTLEQMLAFLRDRGWTVGCHNDYHQNGRLWTFWLFTGPNGRFIKAEAQSDAVAVACVADQVRTIQ